MSFFGITQLGFQNYVREHSTLAKSDPVRGTRQLGFVALPPLIEKNTKERGIIAIDQTSAYGHGNLGSINELTRMKTQHIRNPQEPTALYFYPPTTGSEPGWWTKDSPIHVKRPWTQVPKKPRINSEMTRFVNTMALTNRQFTLF